MVIICGQEIVKLWPCKHTISIWSPRRMLRKIYVNQYLLGTPWGGGDRWIPRIHWSAIISWLILSQWLCCQKQNNNKKKEWQVNRHLKFFSSLYISLHTKYAHICMFAYMHTYMYKIIIWKFKLLLSLKRACCSMHIEVGRQFSFYNMGSEVSHLGCKPW